MRRQPILIQSKVDGTSHAFPADASPIDIEKYFRRYDIGQTLPDFAFSPAYRDARAFNGAQAYQPAEANDVKSAKTVKVTARRGVIAPRPGTRLARSLYLNCLERGEGCDFNVAPNPNANRQAPFYEDANEGRRSVRKYDGAVTSVSNEMNLDPNLLRSLIFMETSHGGVWRGWPGCGCAGYRKECFTDECESAVLGTRLGYA